MATILATFDDEEWGTVADALSIYLGGHDLYNRLFVREEGWVRFEDEEEYPHLDEQ